MNEIRKESNSRIADRYCRVCFNSSGWIRPTGTADEAGPSYYAENRFGHEEWLFNYEWCVNGFKFGFLQPFTNAMDRFSGTTLDVALYTKIAGRTFMVGIIKSVYVPTEKELRFAFDEFIKNGWLDQMRNDVAAVNGKVTAIAGNEPDLIINVRFRPDEVTLYDPMPEFPTDSKPSRTYRYTPISVDGAPLPDHASPASGTTRDEEVRLRAAQAATIVDPRHVRLQNRLYQFLCREHGNDSVDYEREFVDLRLTVRDEVTFFEIKIENSAKRCVRSAIGQLFEYSTYPAARRADRWVVVGSAPATADDQKYLAYLRDQYRIPIFYAQFDASIGTLTNYV